MREPGSVPQCIAAGSKKVSIMIKANIKSLSPLTCFEFNERGKKIKKKLDGNLTFAFQNGSSKWIVWTDTPFLV